MTRVHEVLAACHPTLSVGQVWCVTCGRTQQVDPAECFSRGWPLCCQQTMVLGRPEVRDLAERSDEN